MSRIALQFLFGIVISIAVVLLYLFTPVEFRTLDNDLRDKLFLIRGPIKPTGDVVIVDIDEKSLKELGQWPWQRKKVAKVLQNLSDAGVGIVGLDIVFAEADNSNPAKIVKEMGIKLKKSVEDFDYMLGATIANTPTIPGYVFLMEDDGMEVDEAPSIPAIFIERNRPEDQEFLITPHRPVLNIPIIQDNAYSSGFFNTIPDPSGIIRNVPLLMKFDDMVYPSLSMEMLRAAMGIKKVYVDYDPTIGVEKITAGNLKIPTDRYGQLFVNFRGPGKTFKYLSAVDIYNNNFNKKDIEGKFVLLGTSAAGLLDLRAIPYDNVYPGVEVHANVIDNILAGDYISKPSWIVGVDVAVIFFIGILFSVILAYTSAFVSLLSLIILVAGIFIFNYYMLFTQGLVFNIEFPIILIAFIFTVGNVINYFLETRQKNMVKGKLASKVSPQVMEDLLKSEGTDVLLGTEREVTVFFSDVRGFTNISESMPDPQTLISFMNEYMDPMTEIIIKNEGTVDKFIGDAIMAYWNAPGDVKDHADKAVISTMEQLHALDELNKRIRNDPRFEAVTKMSDSRGVPILDIGIGLNTGHAIVGEMGSKGRSDYTCIGDPINLGARLESLCKFYNSKCNVSNFTKAKLKGKYIYRFLDLVTVKGKKEPVEIWQIHDYDRDESMHKLYPVSRAELDKEIEIYHKAIKLYKAANFSEALKIFKDINSWENKTNKNIYNIYIERCEHYIEQPPKDFNGVFVHTTKG